MRRCLICLVMLSCLAGCAKTGEEGTLAKAPSPKVTPTASSSPAIGKWEGKMMAPPGKENDEMFQKAVLVVGQVPLEIKGDNTFLMNMKGPVEGSWKQSGDRYELTLEKMMGRTMDEIISMTKPDAAAEAEMRKPMVLMISKDGKVLKQADIGPTEGIMVFSKA